MTMLATRPATTPLPMADPETLGLDPDKLNRLAQLIERHIADGRYPGAQFAIARHGQIGDFRTFGDARITPTRVPASADTLWLLFSQTKVLASSAIWVLVDRGEVRFADKVADIVPEFAKHGKGEITLYQVMNHTAGFPSARPDHAILEDHGLMREAVCDFTLEYTPGSRVHYHGLSAHLTCMVVLEAITKHDYREFIHSEILDPIGLGSSVRVGVPDNQMDRCADMHAYKDGVIEPEERNTPEWRRGGHPSAGGYATAAGLASFYQMLLNGGELNGKRVLSPRVIQFVTRNHNGDMVDANMGMPMHRGLGPHVRGYTPTIRGLGTIAAPETFGHGGAGTSYSSADPTSGVSFTYISNATNPEPWHTIRLDKVANLAHAAIIR